MASSMAHHPMERKKTTRRSTRHATSAAGPSGGPGGTGSRAAGGAGTSSGGRNHHPSTEVVPTQSSAAKCKDYCRKFLAFLVSHVGLCVLVVGYAIGGALVFQSIEAPHEDKLSVVMQVNRLRNSTLDALWNVTTALNVFNKELWSIQTELKVKAYQEELVKRIKEDGYDGSLEGSWSFSGSFLFSLTVITTIGKLCNTRCF